MGSKPTGRAPCKNSCEAQSFYIEIRSLTSQIEKLETEKKQRERMMTSTIRARIFNHFLDEHKIMLLESEIDDVINLFKI